MRRPVNSPYTISTEFGVSDPNALFKYHSGVDYAVPSGTAVYAPTTGTIIYAQYHDIRGNMVGIFDGTYTHRLMHNSQFKVGVGNRVSEGQIVALSGSTGLSTGPHVHWDVIRGNKMDATAFSDFVDPATLLFAPVPSAPVQDVLQPYQRRVRSDDSINYRNSPTRSGTIIDAWPANDVADFKGWVYGESVDGNNIWFVGRYTGGYAWSGGFTNTGTDGLDNLNTPTPAPQPMPAPVQEAYTFNPDFSFVEYKPANIKNFQKGNFPATPRKVVIHDFGTAGRDTVTSTVNWFQNPASEISAHFVVSGTRIIQMVSLNDRAWHAGPNGDAFVGIETDPRQDPETIASVNRLLDALENKYGYRLEPIKHSSIMSTACGDDINMDNYVKATPVTPSKPSVTPPAPQPEPTTNANAVIVRAAWTFVQTFLGVITAGLVLTDFSRASIIALLASAVAAGLSAVKNIFVNAKEAK